MAWCADKGKKTLPRHWAGDKTYENEWDSLWDVFLPVLEKYDTRNGYDVLEKTTYNMFKDLEVELRRINAVLEVFNVDIYVWPTPIHSVNDDMVKRFRKITRLQGFLGIGNSYKSVVPELGKKLKRYRYVFIMLLRQVDVIFQTQKFINFVLLDKLKGICYYYDPAYMTTIKSPRPITRLAKLMAHRLCPKWDVFEFLTPWKEVPGQGHLFLTFHCVLLMLKIPNRLPILAKIYKYDYPLSSDEELTDDEERRKAAQAPLVPPNTPVPTSDDTTADVPQETSLTCSQSAGTPTEAKRKGKGRRRGKLSEPTSHASVKSSDIDPLVDIMQKALHITSPIPEDEDDDLVQDDVADSSVVNYYQMDLGSVDDQTPTVFEDSSGFLKVQAHGQQPQDLLLVTEYEQTVDGSLIAKGTALVTSDKARADGLLDEDSFGETFSEYHTTEEAMQTTQIGVQTDILPSDEREKIYELSHIYNPGMGLEGDAEKTPGLQVSTSENCGQVITSSVLADHQETVEVIDVEQVKVSEVDIEYKNIISITPADNLLSIPLPLPPGFAVGDLLTLPSAFPIPSMPPPAGTSSPREEHGQGDIIAEVSAQLNLVLAGDYAIACGPVVSQPPPLMDIPPVNVESHTTSGTLEGDNYGSTTEPAADPASDSEGSFNHPAELCEEQSCNDDAPDASACVTVVSQQPTLLDIPPVNVESHTTSGTLEGDHYGSTTEPAAYPASDSEGSFYHPADLCEEQSCNDDTPDDSALACNLYPKVLRNVADDLGLYEGEEPQFDTSEDTGPSLAPSDSEWFPKGCKLDRAKASSYQGRTRARKKSKCLPVESESTVGSLSLSEWELQSGTQTLSDTQSSEALEAEFNDMLHNESTHSLPELNASTSSMVFTPKKSRVKVKRNLSCSPPDDAAVSADDTDWISNFWRGQYSRKLKKAAEIIRGIRKRREEQLKDMNISDSD